MSVDKHILVKRTGLLGHRLSDYGVVYQVHDLTINKHFVCVYRNKAEQRYRAAVASGHQAQMMTFSSSGSVWLRGDDGLFHPWGDWRYINDDE